MIERQDHSANKIDPCGVLRCRAFPEISPRPHGPARPVPHDVVDESKEEIPEFVTPRCPSCGSDDVVLEGVDPENTWRCEACDHEWSESAEVTREKTAEAGGSNPKPSQRQAQKRKEPPGNRQLSPQGE